MNSLKEKIKGLNENPIFLKYKNLILPVASLLICILLLAFLIIPHILSITKNNNVTGETKQKYNTLNNKLNVLKQTDESSYQENLKTALLAVPIEKNIPGALNQMLSLLGSSKLQLDSIGFGTNQNASAGEGAGETYTISVGVSGETQALKDFILRIKKAPMIMRFNTLEVSGGKAGGTIQATMSIIAYFQPLPTDIGNIEKPISSLDDTDKAVLSQIKSYQQNISIPISTGVIGGSKGKADPFQ